MIPTEEYEPSDHDEIRIVRIALFPTQWIIQKLVNRTSTYGHTMSWFILAVWARFLCTLAENDPEQILLQSHSPLHVEGAKAMWIVTVYCAAASMFYLDLQPDRYHEEL